jgi:hypothetical protein
VPRIGKIGIALLTAALAVAATASPAAAEVFHYEATNTTAKGVSTTNQEFTNRRLHGHLQKSAAAYQSRRRHGKNGTFSISAVNGGNFWWG